MDEQAKASREKYWSELSIEEKLERTRRMVNITREENNRLSALVSTLRQHIHVENEMFFKEERSIGMVNMEFRAIPGKDPDDVYF